MNRFQGLKAHLRRTAGLTLALLMGLGTLAVPVMAEGEPLNLSTEINISVKPQYLDESLEKIIVTNGVSIDIYQIAKAVKLDNFDTYTFELCNGFTDGEGGNLGIADINGDNIDLAKWEEVAQAAADVILNKGGIERNSWGQLGVEGGTVKLAPNTGTDTTQYGGLYLMIVRGGIPDTVPALETYLYPSKEGEPITTFANSDTLTYKFLPILFAAPSKTDSQNITFDTSDLTDWIYDRTLYLKGESEIRLGNLQLLKDLAVYEERGWTKEPATFVFQIDGYTEKNNVKTNIYSNIKTIVLGGPGQSDPIIIKDQPAGAKFTITEIYPGQNYKKTGYTVNPASAESADAADSSASTDSVTVTILADSTVSVTYNNTWDNTYRGGGSVENIYSEDTGGRKHKASNYSDGRGEQS